VIDQSSVQEILGDEVYDRNGEKIGKVGQVYVDNQSGQPVWVTVKTGLFGMKESFVPIQDAKLDGRALRVSVPKDMVHDAPRVDSERGRLSADEERHLYSYYHLQYAVPGQRQGQRGQGAQPGQRAGQHTGQAGQRAGMTGQQQAGMTGTAAGTAAGTAGTTGRETGQRARAGRSDVDGGRDDAMTRSEERLNVGTEQVETGQVRLRKYVVTEQQQVTVPVRHEEVRLEREPITDANRDKAMRGPDISEAEHEVTLHAERPVASKEAVPVERVRLGKEVVTDEQTVSDEVRKERIEVEDNTRQGTTRRDRPRDQR
jgi:uncharacterized protein (TIGR02271 family)